MAMSTIYVEQIKVSVWFKLALLVLVVVPPPAAIHNLLFGSVSRSSIIAFFITWYFISLGVTVGLHRYFTHQSFRASRPLKLVLCILASLAIEGPIITWVANHKYHHAFSDKRVDGKRLDLHSPVPDDDSVWSLLVGLFHAHVGWLGSGRKANKEIYAKHLLNDKMIVFFSNAAIYLGMVAISIMLPYFIGGWEAFVWVGLVRIALVHHFTWSVNSICHVFGERPYESTEGDQSTNIPSYWFLWVFTLGESWHRNHHTFQQSAIHGSHWIVDPSAQVIWILERVKLVDNVVRIPRERWEKKRIRRAI